MDDCNENVQAEIKYRIASSDSSMDDCNPETTYEVEEIYTVQIPLWTIVTFPFCRAVIPGRCSDSSMDDCNESVCYYL